ncbi:MAG: alpha/beta hydrolase family protein [Nocardioidaceae bacterium]
MALITCDAFSETLEVGVSLTVVLPQATEAQIGVSATGERGAPPVLYLLHGLSDDHTAWLRYTSIERYAAEAGLAVVMPAVGRSFYANEAHGHRYWDYVSEELPEIVGSFFHVSQEPEDTFVAGLSMGGYGAMKLALHHPDRFAAAASMSGALDLAALFALGERIELLERVFDGRLGPADDLMGLLDRPALPRLWVGSGTEDPIHAGSARFADAARAAGHDVTVDWRPGGHVWPLWDAMVQDVIAWMLAPHTP